MPAIITDSHMRLLSFFFLLAFSSFTLQSVHAQTIEEDNWFKKTFFPKTIDPNYDIFKELDGKEVGPDEVLVQADTLLGGAPLTIDFDEEEEDDERIDPIIKKKRKVFFGIKTRKRFAKTGFGDKMVLELFYTIKKKEMPKANPDAYVRDIHWFDRKERKIKISSNPNEKDMELMHGPYQKLLGDQVIEEGVFYHGMKHQRWMTYNRRDILLHKLSYHKGWPKESKITYFDTNKKLVKEVIPIEYGKREGNYYHFHRNGAIAVRGEFKNDQPVGKWMEYYKLRQKRKKEIIYPNDPYRKNKGDAYISKEWDRNGRLIYDRERIAAERW
ncbi:MAG: hypothetical protein LAT68_04365 [Cyclobacteriaceae bacterium]|nr:hypothetical protein [Cyclobacteriaceae bacterium]MCH8515543.1 hypothetical protein [Cyclobacteriaceae bacterium]